MKILCLCEGGNVRSVAAASLLKMNFNQDTLAAGWRWNTPETLELLFSWADKIILMQECFQDKVPSTHHNKVVVLDVGIDCYGTPFHPVLQENLNNRLQDWSNRGMPSGVDHVTPFLYELV